MSTSLYLTETSSIKSIVPALKERLETDLYALVKTNLARSNDHEKIARNMLLWTGLLGQTLGKSLGHHVLVGKGDDSILPAHVEGIYSSSGICRYFALGCIHPSESGGETRLFDTYKAASIIAERHPDLSDVVIEYCALAHPEEKIRYKLVSRTKNGKPMLMYRSKVVTNKVLDYDNHDNLYTTVDAILEECLILSYKWNAGDILFVNNVGTIHDRLPYSGARRMLRVRFDDNQYTEATY